jgi:hypothetical protein
LALFGSTLLPSRQQQQPANPKRERRNKKEILHSMNAGEKGKSLERREKQTKFLREPLLELLGENPR